MKDSARLTLLNSAIRDLKKTKDGYHETGPNWAPAMDKLDKLAKDLAPNPVPALGPVYRNGPSILREQLTHKTDGIDYYPAFDTAFHVGQDIIAPEDLAVILPRTSSNPGMAFYARGKSGLKYWFGHLDRAPSVNTRFVKGQQMANVGPNNVGGGPHVHVGINIEELVGKGKQLRYGRTGTGPDYTTGSPAIGVQLAALLEV